jgi:TM2 domain-containing membrane protein YozV
VGSVLFGSQPVSAVTTTTTAATSPVMVAAIPTMSDFAIDENARNRTTFIVLGVLVGLVGAHNFYAGYRRKAITQLCITIFSAGFAAPMIWVWAVIDVCTVDRDSDGKKFRS